MWVAEGCPLGLTGVEQVYLLIMGPYSRVVPGISLESLALRLALVLAPNAESGRLITLSCLSSKVYRAVHCPIQ